MSAVVELLQELIRIPSVNPQGDPGTPHTGEAAIARFVGDILSQFGMEVEFQTVEPDRPNLIARLRSKNSRRHILLGPHLDTVSVGGMTIDPFAATVRDGRVWGRGACDTKGSMAAILVALELLSRSGRRPQDTDIWFAGLMGEESANDGIAFLMKSDFFSKKGVRMDFGIAGEPTQLRIVHRHKGALWFRIRTRGCSCHGSMPELGDNAILKMRRALDYVAGELPAAYARLRDDLLGTSTFSVNTIRGGTKMNIIPDRCEIEVDHRSLPQESHAQVLETVRQALPDCEVEVVSDRLGLDTPADNPYIQHLVAAIRRQQPQTDAGNLLTGAPWFGDCSVMAQHGVPSIAFGPGSGEQAHTKDEFIEVSQLEAGVAVFLAYLRGLE